MATPTLAIFSSLFVVSGLLAQDTLPDQPVKGGLIAEVGEMRSKMQIVVPIGALMPYAGTEINEDMTGWMLCDGRDLDIPKSERDKYSALYAAIKSTYTNTNAMGNGKFSLPDLRGRVAVGRDNMGKNGAGNQITSAGKHGMDGDILGSKGGSQTHTLTEPEMPEHNHGGGDHTHNFAGTISDKLGQNIDGKDKFQNGSDRSLYLTLNTYPTTPSSLGGATIVKQGEDKPHNIVQPSIILNYIIRYQ